MSSVDDGADDPSRPLDDDGSAQHTAQIKRSANSKDRSGGRFRSPLNLRLVTFMLVLTSWIAPARLDEHDHQYKNNEEVILWMNTVGPYHNRQETYSYFSLPFCKGSKQTIGHYHETLGEALQGTELDFSGIDIAFERDMQKVEYCSIELTEESYEALVYAVKNHYWYQMYMDDLPIWGIVGEQGEDGKDFFIWTHKKFEVGFNGNQIVDVNLTSEVKVKLQPRVKIPFTYEVHWRQSGVVFHDRFDKYLDPNFFQHRIHWFSIFNSFMMVIFLVGLVSMILMRTLRKDYARYAKEEDVEEMDRDLGDEYGWKQVHGDVFRPSSHPMLFFRPDRYRLPHFLRLSPRHHCRHSWGTLYGAGIYGLYFHLRLRRYRTNQWVLRRISLREDGRQNLD